MSETQKFIYKDIYSIAIDIDRAEIHIGRTDYSYIAETMYRPLFQYKGNVYFYDENTDSSRKFGISKMLVLMSKRLGIEEPTIIEMGNLRLLDFKNKEDAVVFMFYYYDKLTERYSESILQLRKLS